jgi:Dolichol-phosphate mannosyltransferase subunit 3 (DPM3)
MGLLRYQIFLTYGAVFLSAWYYCVVNAATPSLLVTFAPVWGILGLGAFLFVRLLVGVATYQDCPDAEREIDQQILEARAEMKRRKILE